MASAAEVFDHHLQSFARGDLEEILRDYDEHSLMIYEDRVWRGLAGAREFFTLWLDEWLPSGSRFDLIDQLAVDDTVYLTWTAESAAYIYDFGTDTFVIKDSKVLRQTVATLRRRK